MAGRRPKPTAVKRAAGNPGKRPLNDREPQPRAELPRCPAWLKGEARREWRRMAKELHEIGVLTTIDRAALAGYCVAYGRWMEAEKIVAEKGAVLKTTAGNLIQNPYLAVANKAWEHMMKAAVEFGLTPSSRSRVKVVEVKEATLDELLGLNLEEDVEAGDGEELLM